MALREDFEKIGNWCFRWRSYLPLLLIFLFLDALKTVWYSRFMDAGDRIWEFFCLAVSLSGLAVRAYTVGSVPRNTSGRNVREQRAAALNTTGIYSLIRHPLYFGNLLMWLGAALFVRSWWLPLLTIFVFWFYYEKIMYAEEEYLRKEFGSEFTNWANRTPAFLPYRLKLWKKSELSFDWRIALRREYTGFFGVISVLALLKLMQDRLALGSFQVDSVWRAIFLFGFAFYVAVLTIKKKTKWLEVKGR